MGSKALSSVGRLAVLALLLVWVQPAGGVASGQGAPQAGRVGPGGLGSVAAPPESWEGISLRLARSLVDAQLRAAEEPLFLPRATVREFGSAREGSPLVLRDRFDGWRILSVTAFDYPSGRVVADTARNLQGLAEEDPQAVPEMLVRALSPRPDEAQAAEQTATRWLASALGATRGDQLALILLWDPAPSPRPVFERLTLLLVKAGRLPDGRYRVQAARLGNAQQAAVDGF